MKLSASGDILVPAGFRFAGVAAGIKKSGAMDLALVEAPQGAKAAAIFTSNRVVAAPVELGRQMLKAGKGRMRALIVNSGNANCATGAAGRNASQRVCRAVAKSLGVMPDEVFPSSTGVIGVQLPAGKIVRALPRLVGKLGTSAADVCAFAQAIMTTDTRPKIAAAQLGNSRKGRLIGVAKGAGMIHPRLATMLVFLFSDVEARPEELQKILRQACGRTFNRISVDGDTSTNDTVLLLASGGSGSALSTALVRREFASALEDVCGSLAEQIVSDGEGVKHVIHLRIEQAKREGEAEQIAAAIARSALVKTAWAGADPNWGRILAAIGASGVEVDPGKVDIFFGSQQVCKRGVAWAFDQGAAHQLLSQPEFEIRVVVGGGRAAITYLTCDLTTEYVHINADYRT